MAKYNVYDCSMIELSKHHSDRKGNSTACLFGAEWDRDRDSLSNCSAQTGVLCKKGLEYTRLSLPITEQIADQELSLPIGPTTTKSEVEIVVGHINAF